MKQTRNDHEREAFIQRFERGAVPVRPAYVEDDVGFFGLIFDICGYWFRAIVYTICGFGFLASLVMGAFAIFMNGFFSKQTLLFAGYGFLCVVVVIVIECLFVFIRGDKRGSIGNQ
jgi:hypothetical protein